MFLLVLKTTNMFKIEGKVAIITGGASGMGLQYAKELLRNGLKGCTIADIDNEFGNQAIKEIAEEFEGDRAIFIKTDVTIKSQFEDAFKATLKKFQNIDILINNARNYERCRMGTKILINLNGTVHGCLLALEEYLPKYKSGEEGLIINIASVSGLDEFASMPIYVASKHAVIGLSRSFAIDLNYKRTQVKILTVCPGGTDTPLVNNKKFDKKCLNPAYAQYIEDDTKHLTLQSPKFVAECLIRIINQAENGSVWLVEHEEPPCEMIFTNRHERKKFGA